MITNASMPLLFHLHPVPVAIEDYAGSGYPVYDVGHPGKKKKRIKRHNIDEVLDIAMCDIYELATEEGVPIEVQQEAARLVKPYAESKARIPEANTVDWVALERSAATIEKLLALWQEELDQNLEDEDIVLMAYRHYYQ